MKITEFWDPFTLLIFQEAHEVLINMSMLYMGQISWMFKETGEKSITPKAGPLFHAWFCLKTRGVFFLQLFQ